MTLSDLLQIGDEVVFKVDPERRAWTNTYDDVRDGTIGVVCGFHDAIIYRGRIRVYRHTPGTYHSKGAVSVWLPDGRVVPGDYSITMVDQDEERRRNIAMRDEDGVLRDNDVRLGDLPATKFWEHDKVRANFPGHESLEMTIASISYGNMYGHRNDGSPYPFYEVSFAEGGTTSAEECWLELIERGNVWKYYNDQPLTFADIKEEAGFFQLVGQTEEVRNPRTNFYTWEKDEVLEAIKNGIVHGFTVSGGFFGSGPSIQAIRFNDSDLGRRVAQATLAGFDLTPA